MRLGLTQKQLQLIVKESKKEVKEQEAVAAAPSAGTSSTQSGGQGYPQVNKWESGVTRGAGNQVGVTKWSDVVGNSLKRGKANPLK
jgi:hypothetical protein